MTTQIAFGVDAELKKKFMAKAKKEGLTLKAFLSYCMREYTTGGLGLRVTSQDEDDTQWTPLINFRKEGVTNDEFISFVKDSL